MSRSTENILLLLLLALAGPVNAQPAPQRLPVLDVPFISQSEALCGGAAAAMVLRYWGARGLSAESFAHLVDESAAGIRTDALIADLNARGWIATGIEGFPELVSRELADGRPVLTLIEDRPGTFHYVVVVAATPGAVVFHDPARAPFRVMVREEFSRRWEAADRWMAVVLPRQPSADAGDPPPPVPADPAAAVPTPCERAVAEGIRLAQADDLDGAERVLGGALTCPGAAVFRELAGVRLLQKRWTEVEELASAALSAEPSDTYAWRLLATSRFVRNEPLSALAAWNEVGEPRLDLLSVRGLSRSRQRPVETLIGTDAGDLLTPQVFTRSERRLRELPSAAATRLEYVPVPGGLAELRATVVEHRLLPGGWWSYAGIGLRAAARREVALVVGAPAGGGERLDVSWRFWPNRPRIAAAFSAPAPWGGIWDISLSSERQPFDRAFDTAERLSARMTVANWVSATARAGIRGGVDRWEALGSVAHAAATLQFLSPGGAASAQLELSGWSGDARFAGATLGAELRSSAARRGPVYLARAGAAVLTTEAPADLWLAGDTGHARPVLLRAHPVLEDGAFRVDRLGRGMVHASAEARHWWPGPAGTAFAAALFVDTARVGRRFAAGHLGDVDAGLGARVAIPGLPGTFRVDLARGLRDGATAWSFAYDP